MLNFLIVYEWLFLHLFFTPLIFFWALNMFLLSVEFPQKIIAYDSGNKRSIF